jgi:hypothetical protein
MLPKNMRPKPPMRWQPPSRTSAPHIISGIGRSTLIVSRSRKRNFHRRRWSRPRAEMPTLGLGGARGCTHPHGEGFVLAPRGCRRRRSLTSLTLTQAWNIKRTLGRRQVSDGESRSECESVGLIADKSLLSRANRRAPIRLSPGSPPPRIIGGGRFGKEMAQEGCRESVAQIFPPAGHENAHPH